MQSSQETIKLLERNDIEMLMLEKPPIVKEAEQDVLRNIVQENQDEVFIDR